MTRDNRNALIAAGISLAVFILVAFLMPSIMLALGEVSTVAAGIVAAIFVAAPFLVLWLRGRSQRRRGDE